MTLTFLLRGLVMGFCIAAPVGPIGLLCIRRSLADGPWMGFAAGLGAATADAAYGCVAGFGLTAVSSFLVGQRARLGLAGGAFLCYLGVRTFLARSAQEVTEAGGRRPLGAYSTTLLLTLTNPMTILSFAGVFAGLGLGRSPNYLAAGLLVLGVFVGSALWWLMLSTGMGLLRSRLGPSWRQTVSRLSGGAIFAFGLAALWQAVSI